MYQELFFVTFSKTSLRYTNPGRATRCIHLINAQHSRAPALSGLLLLCTLVKGTCALVVSAEVVEILDLVDTDDPVLAGEGLLDSGKLRALSRKTNIADTVHGLALREEVVVVVVGHLVPAATVSMGSTIDNVGTRHKYIKLFFMVGVASSSTLYSPRGVKKFLSLTSSGQIPSAILTIHKNLLMSSPE